jgi:tryptophanyl-tRNA synthetase
LRERVHDTTAVLIAAGLDPERCVLFRQGDVQEHTELCWLLSSVTALGELNRMHQFRDKSAQQRELVSAGLLYYPVLQAPERKMSTTGGSEQGTVLVLDDPDVIRRKFKRAVTDSGTEIVRAADKPGVTNLIEILAVARETTPEEVEADMAGARGYGDLKTATAEAVVEWLTPVRERYEELRADGAALEEILATGAEKAREMARETLADVRAAMGVGPPSSVRGGR